MGVNAQAKAIDRAYKNKPIPSYIMMLIEMKLENLFQTQNPSLCCGGPPRASFRVSLAQGTTQRLSAKAPSL